MRQAEFIRYFAGRQAKEKYPQYIIDIIEKGVPTQAQLLPEILAGFYFDCCIRPTYVPVIVLEPPGLWNDKIRGEVAYSFVRQFQQPSVSFLSSAVAVLCG